MTDINEGVCPCGSGKTLGQCCGMAISGEKPAETAEALMRSRYTAYSLGDEAYLLASWYPQTRPESLDLELANLTWTGLEIVQCQAGGPGDLRGLVEFVAHYDKGGRQGQVHETSRFQKQAGVWLYVDGDLKTIDKPGRNAPCPCGSGKKYKRCCGSASSA